MQPENGECAKIANELRDLIRTHHKNATIIATSNRLIITLLHCLFQDQASIFATYSEEVAFSLLNKEKAYLLLCTDELDHGSGIDLIKNAKAAKSNTKCILFTSRSSMPTDAYAPNITADAILAFEDLSGDERPLQKAQQALKDGSPYWSPSARMDTTNQGNPLDSLTPREKSVLSYILKGCTNAEIAEALTISPSTAKSYSRNVLHKLGVQNRQKAIIMARSIGFADSIYK